MADLVDLLPGSGVDDAEAETSFWAEIDRQGTLVTTTTTTTTTNTLVLGVLQTVALADVEPVEAVQITTTGTLPVWAGMLSAIVGEGESGKTWLGVHVCADLAAAGQNVLVLDGEMSATAWRKRFLALGLDRDALAHVHYAEMTDHATTVELVRATVKHLDARLVIWDSALSMLSRTARSENDNAEVGRVYDRLRDIVRDGPAGLIIDHVTRGSGALISRGATAKFNALDVSYGVRLTDGSVPGQTADWSSVISVEKDRHGLLGNRADREATFQPLGAGRLEIDVALAAGSSHRLSAGNPTAELIARIAEMEPPPTSGNDVARRLGGRKQSALDAYRLWKESA